MKRHVYTVKNPLSIIGIFAGVAEVAGVTTLPCLDYEIQKFFVWYVMLFPTLLLALFFYTLIYKTAVLYSPSDWRSERLYSLSMGYTSEDDIEQRAEDAAKASGNDKVKVAQEYIQRWNSADMEVHKSRLRRFSRESLVSDEEIYNALIAVYNFLEEAAISIQKGLVDEQIMKSHFKNIVIETWKKTSFVIKERRKETGNKELYKHYQELKNSWSDG